MVHAFSDVLYYYCIYCSRFIPAPWHTWFLRNDVVCDVAACRLSISYTTHTHYYNSAKSVRSAFGIALGIALAIALGVGIMIFYNIVT